MNKRRRRIMAAAAVVAAALVLDFTLSRPSSIVLTGVVATDDVIVSPSIQGRIEELRVREGDTVHKGDVLAVIQPAEWRADFDYYSSTERQASAAVAEGQADLRYQQDQTEGQIRQAQANLAAAVAQADAAGADLESARLAFQRAVELRRSRTNSEQDLDNARTAYDGARARAEAARRQAAAAAAALALAQASVSEVAARQANLKQTEQGLAAMEAQREKARVYLDYTQIRAPIDGVVDLRAARQGEEVAVAQPILTLVDPDDLWVRADVEESYVDRVRLGDRLTVRLPSGAEMEGTVYFRRADADYATQRDVSRTKRDIKTFEIRLRCDNRDRRLALGMTAYVILPLAR